MMSTRIVEMVTTLLTTTAALSGCATMRESLILGAGSGIAAGATVGAVASASGAKGSGALVGGLIGAAVGLGGAYFIQKGVEDHDSKVRKDTLFNLERFGVSDAPTQSSSVPSVSFRVVEEQKIETHRQGNKIIEGHRVWMISDDSNISYTDGKTRSDKK